MTINGVLVAKFRASHGLRLVESHPKLMVNAYLKEHKNDDEIEGCVERFDKIAKKSEHEADAFVAAWCASRCWSVNLYEDIEDEQMYPAGKACYPWPEQLP